MGCPVCGNYTAQLQLVTRMLSNSAYSVSVRSNCGPECPHSEFHSYSERQRKPMNPMNPILVIAITLILGLFASAQSPQDARDWQLNNSVAVRYLFPDVSPFQDLGPWPPDQMIHLSPDGQAFFFITYHGDL